MGPDDIIRSPHAKAPLRAWPAAPPSQLLDIKTNVQHIPYLSYLSYLITFSLSCNVVPAQCRVCVFGLFFQSLSYPVSPLPLGSGSWVGLWTMRPEAHLISLTKKLVSWLTLRIP